MQYKENVKFRKFQVTIFACVLCAVNLQTLCACERAQLRADITICRARWLSDIPGKFE